MNTKGITTKRTWKSRAAKAKKKNQPNLLDTKTNEIMFMEMLHAQHTSNASKHREPEKKYIHKIRMEITKLFLISQHKLFFSLHRRIIIVVVARH